MKDTETKETEVKPKELVIIKGEMLSKNEGCGIYIFEI